jgi:hypothetical protein
MKPRGNTYLVLTVLFGCNILTSLGQIETVLYSQDFESGTFPQGWTTPHDPTSIGWQIGFSQALSSEFFTIPPKTGLIAVDNDDACGEFCDGSNDVLITPTILFATAGRYFIRFDSFFTGEWGQTASIWITNGTGTFVELVTLDPNPDAVWTTLTYFFFAPANRQISFKFWSNDNFNWGGGWAIDNVVIGIYDWTGVVPNCASLVAPTDGDTTVADFVTLTWRSGNIEGSGFPYGYYYYFGTDNPPTNIVNGNHTNPVFTSRSFSNLVQNTTYYWQVIPHGDVVATGCPVWSFTSTLPPVIEFTPPYLEDFEHGPNGWTTGGSFSSWAFGTPNKTTIRGASSGTNAFVNGGLTSTYNNYETSWLLSPVFNLTGETSEVYIQFSMMYFTEDTWDGFKVQVSIDEVTWTDVGILFESNWYDTEVFALLPNPAGWSGIGPSTYITVSHVLPSFVVGQERVRIRIYFASDANTRDQGVAIDDFLIKSVPTVVPKCAKILYPQNGDNDLALQLALEWVRDTTDDPLLPLGYYLYFGTQNPPTDVYDGFNVFVNNSYETPALTPDVTYYWQVVPYGAAGLAPSNCPVWNFTAVAIETTFPYFEDFESGERGWAPLGQYSSWAFGTPQKTVIQGAYSGANSWVTGGLGKYGYNYDEKSYVMSPAFNFTTFTIDPVISLQVWWQSELDYDGASLQYKNATGDWVTIGNLADTDYWYTSKNILSAPGGYKQGWSGRNLYGSGGWVTAVHILTGTAGLYTQLRIAFSSDNSVIDDGFAFDDVRIQAAPVGITPPCANLVFPFSGYTVSGQNLNLQWNGDETIIGLPLGYYLQVGTQLPLTTKIDLKLSTSYNLNGDNLVPGTTYYWRVTPYGYDQLIGSCPIWSFTVPPAVSTAPTSSTVAPSQSNTATHTGTGDYLKSNSTSSLSGGAVAAAVIIPLLVVLLSIVALIFFLRKRRGQVVKQRELARVEAELQEKEDQQKGTTSYNL